MESSFEDYNLKLQASILNPTKHAFALPTDIQFHKSIDRDFAEEIEACSTKVLSITNRLLTLATSSTTNLGGKGKARLIIDQVGVVDDFDSIVVDVTDQLLERVDSCLDVFQGLIKNPIVSVNPDTVETGTKTSTSHGHLDPALQHASHMTKPQPRFKPKPNNHRNVSFLRGPVRGSPGPSRRLDFSSHALFDVFQTTYKATSSLLLGADFSSNRTPLTRSHFSEVKSKIHNTLAVAPTIAIVESETAALTLHDPVDSVDEAEATMEQTEIAFVPVSERRHTTSAAADTVITVGRRNQQKKKRKRNVTSNGAEDDVEIFDYSVEPSILDGGDVKEVGPVKKRRNKEPAPINYGSFPAPPKAHNQPRSGNQSHSFR